MTKENYRSSERLNDEYANIYLIRSSDGKLFNFLTANLLPKFFLYVENEVLADFSRRYPQYLPGIDNWASTGGLVRNSHLLGPERPVALIRDKDLYFGQRYHYTVPPFHTYPGEEELTQVLIEWSLK